MWEALSGLPMRLQLTINSQMPQLCILIPLRLQYHCCLTTVAIDTKLQRSNATSTRRVIKTNTTHQKEVLTERLMSQILHHDKMPHWAVYLWQMVVYGAQVKTFGDTIWECWWRGYWFQSQALHFHTLFTGAMCHNTSVSSVTPEFQHNKSHQLLTEKRTERLKELRSKREKLSK